MGAGEAQAIARALIAAGKPASLPVAVVESASLPQSRTLYTTLHVLAYAGAGDVVGPVLLLVGPQFAARGAGAVAADIDDIVPQERRAAG
jgi:uroporphyrin-III C-methyltransferase